VTIPHTTHNTQKIATLTLFAVLVWVLGLAGCRTVVGTGAVEKYNQNPLTVTIPGNFSPERVEEVMRQTLRARGWSVVQQSPQEVVGTLNHRNFQAKTILKVDGNLIKILDDSYYKGDETGQLEAGVPKGWLLNLQKDLQTRLGK
jgi:hypothetical protein